MRTLHPFHVTEPATPQPAEPVKPRRTVLVVDQCYPLSPYQLQQHPVAFDQLLREVAEAEATQPYYGRRPQVLEVDDDYRPRWATSVFAANDQGLAILWRSQWDSSD